MVNALLAAGKSTSLNSILPGSRPDLMRQAQKLSVKGRTDMSVDQLRAAIGDAIKAMPAAPRGGAAAKARREMAQAEEPAAEVREIPPELQDAAALQIPEGIPAPNPDGSSPYAAAEPEDFDSQLADLQRLFAELDQHDAPEPMQAAQQSRQVAQMPEPWQMASQSQNRLLGAR